MLKTEALRPKTLTRKELHTQQDVKLTRVENLIKVTNLMHPNSRQMIANS